MGVKSSDRKVRLCYDKFILIKKIVSLLLLLSLIFIQVMKGKRA